MNLTMEEFNASLLETMQTECENAKAANANRLLPETEPVVADQSMQAYLKTIMGYTEASSLATAQKLNISAKFPSQSQYGSLIGFIDTGLLLMAKKGKVGIAFCTQGLCERSMTEKNDTGISYTTLCQGILKDKKNNLLSENKFSCRQERVLVIESTGKMFARLQELRVWLLANNQEACSTYHFCYQALLDKVFTSYQDGQLEEAKMWFQSLSEYIYSNSSNGYVVPRQILIILNIAEHNFEVAKMVAEQTENEYWKNFVTEKENLYLKVLNQQCYEEAKNFYQDGQYAEALSSIRNALTHWSTVDSWQLYADLICETANEENNFLLDDLARLTSEQPTLEQAQVVAQNIERINALNEHYQQFITHIHDMIPEKAKQNDVEFFKKYLDLIVDYSDEYGMNAIMYASLFHQSELYNFLEETAINKEQENIILMDCNLLFLATNMYRICGCGQSVSQSTIKNFSEDLMIFLTKISPKFANQCVELKEEYERAKKEVEIAQKAKHFNETLNRNAIRNNNVEAATKTQELIERSEMSLRKNQPIVDGYEKKIIDYIIDHMVDDWLLAWEILEKYLKVEYPEIPEIPENAGLEEYLVFPEYQQLYENERKKFIADYVKENLSPKGEFETTTQFEIRKEETNKFAENMFPEKGLQILQEYHKECIVELLHLQKCNDCAKKLITFLWQSSPKTLHLGSYHADEQYFDFTWESNIKLNEIKGKLHIPLKCASRFKEAFAEGVPFEMYSIDLENYKAQCGFSFESTDYTFELA